MLNSLDPDPGLGPNCLQQTTLVGSVDQDQLLYHILVLCH